MARPVPAAVEAAVAYAKRVVEKAEEGGVGGLQTLPLEESTATGYMGVRKHAYNGRFEAHRSLDGGKHVSIGCYDTAVEAAVAYAKHAAGEEVARPVPAAAMEVEVKEAKGYQLFANRRIVRPATLGVIDKHNTGSKRRHKVDGKLVTIGTYDTAVEAAVAYAKHAAGEIVVEPRVQPEVEVEVKEAEGYELFVSPRSATGYVGVTKQNGRFKAFKGSEWLMARMLVDTAVKAAVAYHCRLRRFL